MSFIFGKNKKNTGRYYSPDRNYRSHRADTLRAQRYVSAKFSIVKKIIYLFVFVILIGGALYLVLFTPLFAVKNITVEGNKIINTDDLKRIVSASADRKIYKIFPASLILINAADIEKTIAGDFDGIKTVKVEKKWPQTIKIFIVEKPVDISWCNKIRVEKADKKASADESAAADIDQCYLSDEEGVIYQKIGEEAKNTPIKVFRDETINIGIKIGNEEIKTFIRKLANDFDRKTGLALSHLYLPSIASRELHLVAGNGWKIYFDLNRGADEQISVLNTFLKNELKSNNNQAADYDYIDLRVVDRVYYKDKNDVKK